MRSNRTLDDLPDDILGKILALLPTKDRAMSEVVSKSWRRASLGRGWRGICLDPLGPAQVRWLKLMANRNPSSLHVFEGVFLPETSVGIVIQHVSCFQDLRHMELKAAYMDPLKLQHLSHLTNLEWLACDYAPYDVEELEGLQFDENNEDIVSINLDSFANFSKLRHLAAVLIDSVPNPGNLIWRVRLGSRFQGLTQLRSLKLGQIHTLHVDASLLQVAARLEIFELESLYNELNLEGQELDTPQLTRFVYKAAPANGGPYDFPLTAAPQLLELTLHGNCIEPVTQAIDICPKLTAVDLAMDKTTDVDAENVQDWADVPMLRRLDLLKFKQNLPLPVLHPFSAYTRLETLRLHVCGEGINVLASPNSMEHLKVLMLASEDVKPFNLGGNLNHLQGLKTLHVSMPHLTGEISSRSLEELKLSFTSFKSDIKAGHRLVGNLPRLHTLHILSELYHETEMMVLAHAIGSLRSLRDLVLLRLSHDKNTAKGFQDIGFTRTMLRSISNTANMYNHVVIIDAGALVLERSSMPHAQHLEVVCSRLSLESEQAEQDWFYRTNSLRVRLSNIKRFESYESTPASVVERLRSSSHLKIRRIQRKISPTSDDYSDYIEASKYEFSSLPPEFHAWSTWSTKTQEWCAL